MTTIASVGVVISLFLFIGSLVCWAFGRMERGLAKSLDDGSYNAASQGLGKAASWGIRVGRFGMRITGAAALIFLLLLFIAVAVD